MNLNPPKIDSLLFWVAWAFGGAFIGSLFLPIRWYVVGGLTLTWCALWLITDKTILGKDKTIREQ